MGGREGNPEVVLGVPRPPPPVTWIHQHTWAVTQAFCAVLLRPVCCVCPHSRPGLFGKLVLIVSFFKCNRCQSALPLGPQHCPSGDTSRTWKQRET